MTCDPFPSQSIKTTPISFLQGVYPLAVQYGLTGYDASYLELAIRKGLPIATLDDELQKAAVASGINLVEI